MVLRWLRHWPLLKVPNSVKTTLGEAENFLHVAFDLEHETNLLVVVSQLRVLHHVPWSFPLLVVVVVLLHGLAKHSISVVKGTKCFRLLIHNHDVALRRSNSDDWLAIN